MQASDLLEPLAYSGFLKDAPSETNRPIPQHPAVAKARWGAISHGKTWWLLERWNDPRQSSHRPTSYGSGGVWFNAHGSMCNILVEGIHLPVTNFHIQER